MNKTFRLNIDVQLDNGTIVPIDQIVLGKDVAEAYHNGSQILLAWPDNHITRVMDLNFSEQIDIDGYLEREYRGSNSQSPEDASIGGSREIEFFRSRMRVAPAAIYLNGELLAVRTETHVMVSSLVQRLGHYVNKDAYIHGFANVPVWGKESDVGAIMMILQNDCFDHLQRHPDEQFSVYDGSKQQLHSISLHRSGKRAENGVGTHDIEGSEPNASKEQASIPALSDQKTAFLRDRLLEDLNHLVVRIEAKGLDIDMGDPLKLKKPPYEGQVLVDMIHAYSSFVQEIEGTPYYDAWISHQQSQEIGSL